MQDDGLSEQERQLEAGLKGLQPVAGLDRDALMFAAGRRGERRKVWTWRATAGGLAALWLVTAGMMGWQGERPPPAAPQLLTLVDARKAPATLQVERSSRAVNALTHSTGGLVAFMRISDPMDRALASDSTVLDLRQRVLIYGVGILPRESNRDSNGLSPGRKNPDELVPTYGSSLRNTQGERL